MKRFSLDDAEDHISEQAVSDGARIAPAGAVFIVVRGMILAHTFPVCIAERAMSFNQDVKALVPQPGVESRFLAHWLHGNRNKLLSLVTEATHGTKRLDLHDLQATEVLLPAPSEQRCIGEVVDTLDKATHKTEQLIAKLKQVKQGVLHDLLTRGIDDNGELRDPDSHPEKFKGSQLGQVPAHWKLSSADAEFEITAGIALGPHRRPNHRPWPYLRVANVHREELELSDVAQLEVLPGELSERQLAQGDLLVVEGHANPAEIGRCAMTTAEVTGYTFQNHLFRLRAKQMLPEFCLRWMNSSWTQAYWRRECATSSGLNTINRTKLRRLTMLVPLIAEQQFIVQRIDAITAQIHTEQSALGKLLALKHGLMEDLLTGRVRVTSLLNEGIV